MANKGLVAILAACLSRDRSVCKWLSVGKFHGIETIMKVGSIWVNLLNQQATSKICNSAVLACVWWISSRQRPVITRPEFTVIRFRSRFLMLPFRSLPIGAFQWPITSSITLTYVTYLAWTTRVKTLSPLLNRIEQCFAAHVVHTWQQYWAWIGCNNIVQYCWQLWTMWAAKHCSILFSSILQPPDSF
jgi:hypothetical protein